MEKREQSTDYKFNFSKQLKPNISHGNSGRCSWNRAKSGLPQQGLSAKNSSHLRPNSAPPGEQEPISPRFPKKANVSWDGQRN